MFGAPPGPGGWLRAGLLAGSGYLLGDVVNAARIDVGGVGAAGVLYIDGNYSQTATGILGVELGNHDARRYDTLAITGAASLDGTLQVSLLSGFTAREGDVYVLLSYASATGQFATVNLPDPGSGLFLEPYSDGTHFYLIVSRRS